MASITSPTAVAVFDTREQADRAAEELRAAGFADTEIGFGARREPGSDSVTGPPTWEYGAGVGGLTGASVGGLAAGPPGMVAGGVVGLLLGTLIDLGVNDEDAQKYNAEAEAGRVVVTVRAGGRHGEAREILARHGGREFGG
jgi:hypothetical protein